LTYNISSTFKSGKSILFPQEFADGFIQFFAYIFVLGPAGNFLGVAAGNFTDIIGCPG